MKVTRIAQEAGAVMAQVDAFLRRDPHAELVRLHAVRALADLQPGVMPGFILAYLSRMLPDKSHSAS